MIQYEVFTAGYANTKLLEKDAKNKWRSRGTLMARSTRSATVKETRQSWNGLLQRIHTSGKTISYKSSGKKAFHLHAEDAKHKASFRTVKSNQVSRFLYLSNWKKVVLWTRTFVNISHNTPPTLFPILSCPSLLLARDSTGRGCKWNGLTHRGEPMPIFFSRCRLCFFLGGWGAGWHDFFSGCGLRVNQIILLLLIAIHF